VAQGYKDFTAGAVLTAADLEDYCENQSVLRFASAATRDSALSVVKTEGMMAYLIDVNTMTVYSGSAWSTVGPLHGALTAWTPAITQSGSVTCTVTYATYQRIGRMIHFDVHLTCTGAGTGANAVVVTLPVTAHGSLTTQSTVGVGSLIDASTTSFWSGLLRINAGSASVKITSGSTTDGTYLGASVFTAALAAGDVITMNGRYEAAADA
jgi:hypothetical protein